MAEAVIAEKRMAMLLVLSVTVVGAAVEPVEEGVFDALHGVAPLLNSGVVADPDNVWKVSDTLV